MTHGSFKRAAAACLSRTRVKARHLPCSSHVTLGSSRGREGVVGGRACSEIVLTGLAAILDGKQPRQRDESGVTQECYPAGKRGACPL